MNPRDAKNLASSSVKKYSRNYREFEHNVIVAGEWRDLYLVEEEVVLFFAKSLLEGLAHSGFMARVP